MIAHVSFRRTFWPVLLLTTCHSRSRASADIPASTVIDHVRSSLLSSSTTCHVVSIRSTVVTTWCVVIRSTVIDHVFLGLQRSTVITHAVSPRCCHRHHVSSTSACCQRPRPRVVNAHVVLVQSSLTSIVHVAGKHSQFKPLA